MFSGGSPRRVETETTRGFSFLFLNYRVHKRVSNMADIKSKIKDNVKKGEWRNFKGRKSEK